MLFACSGPAGLIVGAGAAADGSRVGSRAPRPLPKALRGFCCGVVTLENLLRQLNVALCSAGPDVICQNWFSMTRCLCQPNAARNHSLKYVCSKEFSQVACNLPRQIRP